MAPAAKSALAMEYPYSNYAYTSIFSVLLFFCLGLVAAPVLTVDLWTGGFMKVNETSELSPPALWAAGFAGTMSGAFYLLALVTIWTGSKSQKYSMMGCMALYAVLTILLEFTHPWFGVWNFWTLFSPTAITATSILLIVALAHFLDGHGDASAAELLPIAPTKDAPKGSLAPSSALTFTAVPFFGIFVPILSAYCMVFETDAGFKEFTQGKVFGELAKDGEPQAPAHLFGFALIGASCFGWLTASLLLGAPEKGTNVKLFWSRVFLLWIAPLLILNSMIAHPWAANPYYALPIPFTGFKLVFDYPLPLFAGLTAIVGGLIYADSSVMGREKSKGAFAWC